MSGADDSNSQLPGLAETPPRRPRAQAALLDDIISGATLTPEEVIDQLRGRTRRMKEQKNS